MDIFLFVVLVLIAIFAGFQVLKSLMKTFSDAHDKTMKDLQKEETKSDPGSPTVHSTTGHRTALRNVFDKKEY